MAGGFSPLGPFSSKAAEEEGAAAVVGEEGVMAGQLGFQRCSSKDVAVGEGEPTKGTSTKRKAEKALSPTGEKGPLEGCATKRKAEEPSSGCLMGEKSADVMTAASAEGTAAAAGGDGKGAPASGTMEVEEVEEEKEEEEEEEGVEEDKREWIFDFMATLSPWEIEFATANIDVPVLVISSCRDDFYDDESEEGESDDEDHYDEDEEVRKCEEVEERRSDELLLTN